MQLSFFSSIIRKIAPNILLFTTLIVSSKAIAFNSESITFFVKPLAWKIGKGAFEMNNLVDLGYRSDNNGNAKYDTHMFGVSLAFQTQLQNDWDFAIHYIADYANDRSNDYQGSLRIGLLDQWGEVQLGDISALTYERTSRLPAIGLLGIDNDDFTLKLKNIGGFYQWQTPASRFMLALDNNANYQLGASYYQAIKGIEYTLNARISSAKNDQGDAQGVHAGDGFAITTQAQRGRWSMDVQYLYEELVLLSETQTYELDVISAGIHYSLGRWQWSLTGMVRENELDDKERTAALGLRYDIARGLSVNAGVSANNSKFIPENFLSLASSVRYEF